MPESSEAELLQKFVEHQTAREERIEEKIDRLIAEVAQVITRSESHHNQLKDIYEKRESDIREKKTPWSNIIAGCVLLGSIGTAVLVPVQASIKYNADKIGELEERERDFALAYSDYERKMAVDMAEQRVKLLWMTDIENYRDERERGYAPYHEIESDKP